MTGPEYDTWNRSAMRNVRSRIFSAPVSVIKVYKEADETEAYCIDCLESCLGPSTCSGKTIHRLTG